MQSQLREIRRAFQIVGRKFALAGCRVDSGKIALKKDRAGRLSGNRDVAGLASERDKRRQLGVVKSRFGAERQVRVGKIDVRRNVLLLPFEIRGQIGIKLLVLGRAVENDLAERVAVYRDICSRAVEIDLVGSRIVLYADGLRG